MTFDLARGSRRTVTLVILLLGAVALPVAAQQVLPLANQSTPTEQARAFATAIAEAAAGDEAIAGFYRDRGYAAFWTGVADSERRAALLQALAGSGAHGLPTARYDPMALIAAVRAGREVRAAGPECSTQQRLIFLVERHRQIEQRRRHLLDAPQELLERRQPIRPLQREVAARFRACEVTGHRRRFGHQPLDQLRDVAAQVARREQHVRVQEDAHGLRNASSVAASRSPRHRSRIRRCASRCRSPGAR